MQTGIIKTTRFRIYHMLLSLLIIAICGLAMLMFGFTLYAVITGRPGGTGQIYHSYSMTYGQFVIYYIAVICLGVGLILLQAKFLWKKDAKNLIKTFWTFGFLVGLIIIIETSFFVGKG